MESDRFRVYCHYEISFVEVAAATYLVFKWSNFIDLQNNLIRIAT
jgi:hypothetical protein